MLNVPPSEAPNRGQPAEQPDAQKLRIPIFQVLRQLRGGVAVKNIVGNQEDVVRIDSTGNPTLRHLGTWRLGGTWRRIEFNLFRKQRVERNPRRSCDRGPCGQFHASSTSGLFQPWRTPQAQGSPSPDVRVGMTKIATCTGVQTYARYPIYSLRLGTTTMIQEPQCQNAANQQSRSSSRFSPIRQSVQAAANLIHANMPTEPVKSQYNEFADEISAGIRH